MESHAQPDRSIQLAERRTLLALERTLMAWLRTTFAMIGFGIALVESFRHLAADGRPGANALPAATWLTDTIGFGFVVLGTGSLIAAILQHRRRHAALTAVGAGRGTSLVVWVAALVAVLGVVAAASLAVDW